MTVTYMKINTLFFKIIILLSFGLFTSLLFSQNNCDCSNTTLKNEITLLNKRDSIQVFKVIDILKKSKSESCVYKGLGLEIEYYCEQKNLDKAYNLLLKQEKIFKKSNCKSNFSYNFYANKARYYLAKGDLEKLSEYAFKALKKAEQDKDVDKEIESLKQLVFLFTRMQQNSERWNYVKRAEKLIINQTKSIQSISDLRWLAFQYENEYTKTERKSLIDTTLLYINRSKKDALKYEMNYEITQLYRGLEAYSYHKGELNNALMYIDSAIYYGKQIKGIKNISGLYLSKSWDHFDLGQDRKASQAMDTALFYDNSKAKGTAGYMMLQSQASEIYEGVGELDKALTSYKIYSKLKDSIINNNRIEIVNELEAKYKSELKDKEIKNKQSQINKLLALIIALALIATIILFVIKTIQLRKVRTINTSLEKAVEKQLKLEKELTDVRDNLAQDFHDDLGNKLARLSFISKMIASDSSLKNLKVKNKINQITKDANSLYNGTRDFIFSLKSNSNCLEEVVTYLSDFGEEYFSKTDVKFVLIKKINKKKLPHYWSKQLVYIFKEALTNTLKHSKCSQVTLQFEFKNNVLCIRCIDNGVGINKNDLNSKNGLLNMQKRASKIGGKLTIDNNKSGTTIQFTGKTT